MSSSETVLVVMSALALTGFGVLAVVGWVVTASVRSEGELLRGEAERVERKVDEQSRTLGSVSGEVHHARAELARLHALVTKTRAELDALAHGPPSLRSPASGPHAKEGLR